VRHSAALVLLIAVLPCGGSVASYPTPPGFVEACSGDLPKAGQLGPPAAFRMRFPADESMWPRIRQTMLDIGKRRALKFFDTGVIVPRYHVLNVHVCAPHQVWAFADQRIAAGDPPDSPSRRVLILLWPKSAAYDWHPLAADLRDSFAGWPGVETDWPTWNGT
jgi:hypothetical protein